MKKLKNLQENIIEGLVNKCGLFAALSVALSIVLSISFSAVGNAQSQFDDLIQPYMGNGNKIEICGIEWNWTEGEILKLYNARLAYLINEYPEYADELGYMSQVIGHEDSILITNGLPPNYEGSNKTQQLQIRGYYSHDSFEANNRITPEFQFYKQDASRGLELKNGEYLEYLQVQINTSLVGSYTSTCDDFLEDIGFDENEDLIREDFADMTYMTLAYGSGENLPYMYDNFAGRIANNRDLFSGYTFRDSVYDDRLRLGEIGNNYWYVLSASDIIMNYPENYQGMDLPGEVILDSLGLKTVAPDFQYTWNNLNLWANDHEQDLPVFIPDLEGYADDGYRVEWTVWECRGGEWNPETASCNGGQTELLKLETLGVNENFTFDVPQLGEYRLQAEYRVSQCYRYESYPETPDNCFSSSPTAEPNLNNYNWEKRAVIIDMDGGAGSGDTLEMECGYGGFNCDPSTADSNMLPCFTSDFPYINVNNCVKNVFTLYDILTFGRTNIFGFTTNTLVCKYIPRIGDWLNLDNRYICPQFPGHVRDLITPFVTLTLGLFMVIFITRIGRETYN